MIFPLFKKNGKLPRRACKQPRIGGGGTNITNSWDILPTFLRMYRYIYPSTATGSTKPVLLLSLKRRSEGEKANIQTEREIGIGWPLPVSIPKHLLPLERKKKTRRDLRWRSGSRTCTFIVEEEVVLGVRSISHVLTSDLTCWPRPTPDVIVNHREFYTAHSPPITIDQIRTNKTSSIKTNL